MTFWCSAKVTRLQERWNLCSHCVVKLHEATQMFMMLILWGKWLWRSPVSMANMDYLSVCSSCHGHVFILLAIADLMFVVSENLRFKQIIIIVVVTLSSHWTDPGVVRLGKGHWAWKHISVFLYKVSKATKSTEGLASSWRTEKEDWWFQWDGATTGIDG